jgi:hypothetical protein
MSLRAGKSLCTNDMPVPGSPPMIFPDRLHFFRPDKGSRHNPFLRHRFEAVELDCTWRPASPHPAWLAPHRQSLHPLLSISSSRPTAHRNPYSQDRKVATAPAGRRHQHESRPPHGEPRDVRREMTPDPRNFLFRAASLADHKGITVHALRVDEHKNLGIRRAPVSGEPHQPDFSCPFPQAHPLLIDLSPDHQTSFLPYPQTAVSSAEI